MRAFTVASAAAAALLLRLALGVAALLACAAAVADAQPLFGPAQDPVAGSRVFGAKGCARCHSVKGAGGKIGPDLGRTDRAQSFYDLAAALWNHAPRMADRMRDLGIARPHLDARESGDLVAFLFTVDYFDRPGNADAGRRVFTQKRCVVCHQVGGAGGVIGPSFDSLAQRPTPISLASALWNHGPQMAAAMQARGIERPTFKSAELQDLIAYVDAASKARREEPLHLLPGNPEEGRRLFADKRCVMCHGPGGRGATLAPDLSERRLHGSVLDFAAAMWNKAPAMAAAMQRINVALPQLVPAEMADLLAYLYSVRYLAPVGDAHAGAAVANAKGCLTCHALGGERGKRASDLGRARSVDSPAGLLSALWNHAFLGERRAARERAPWAEMNGAQMADLLAFLRSVRVAP